MIHAVLFIPKFLKYTKGKLTFDFLKNNSFILNFFYYNCMESSLLQVMSVYIPLLNYRSNLMVYSYVLPLGEWK